MKNKLLFAITALFAFLVLQSAPVRIFIDGLFKDENGVRNWQHLANWTGGTLLVLLSVVTVFLFIARRRAYKANLELTAIRNELEVRVKERTAMLHQSNKLLMDSNRALEDDALADASAPLPRSQTQAKLVRFAPPNYPSEARKRRIKAEILVEVDVDERGVVKDARIVQRFLLGKSDADRAKENGQPVRSLMEFYVSFGT